MSGKDKNRKDRLTDFFGYLQNKMKDRERNAFERNLQRDPFADEALEGFENTEPGIIGEDILDLKKRLRKRTAGRKSMIWYQIAASVAVLMIITSIIVVQVRNEPRELLSYGPSQEIPEAIIERPAPIIGPAENRVKAPELIVPVPDKAEESVVELKKKEILSEMNEAVAESADVIDVPVAEKRAVVRVPENIRADAMRSGSDLAKEPAPAYTGIRGTVISSEDNQPLPGVTITVKGTNNGTITDANGSFSLNSALAGGKTLVASFVGMIAQEFSAVEDSILKIRLVPSSVALSEVVVVGYGVTGPETAADDAAMDYTPPVPVTGKAGFEKFIKENLRRPDAETKGQRVVVVAGFLVRSNGEVDSIHIIRSPAEIFSGEAIRLIREGPEWRPATRDNKPVDDEVRVRIVFK